MLELAWVAVGFLAGMVSGLLGIGGGIIFVPALSLIVGLPMHEAVGTSLLIIIPTALSGVWRHHMHRCVDFQLAGVLAVMGIIGALIGASATALMSERALRTAWGIFEIFIAVAMVAFKSRKRGDYAWMQHFSTERKLLAAAIGVVGGIIAGFFGVGGGAQMVPLMVVGLGVPMHIAVGTSLAVIVVNAAGGCLGHFVQGNVIIGVAIFFAAGSIFGAQLGARAAHKFFSERNLQLAAAFVMLLVGLSMLLR